MKKNIIIIVALVVLLIASIGGGWFLMQGKAKLQSQIKTLESEKVTLQNKIGKSLAYAESLDILLDPARKEIGVPSRQNLSEVEMLSKLTERINATGDSKLQGNLEEMKKGGSTAQMATVLFMEHTASAIVDALK